jgi:hypothetical protein
MANGINGENIMSDYNGWTNRATWLINIWFEPQSKDDVMSARDTFEQAVREISAESNWMGDFIDTDINWDELMGHFEEEENEQV